MKKRKEICINFSDDSFVCVDMYLSDFYLLCRNSTTFFIQVDDIMININNITYVEQYFDEVSNE